MSHEKELVINDNDKKKLTCLMEKEKTRGQNFGTATVMGNQNSILIEDDSAKSEELDLIARSNQEGERQLLKIFKEEEEYAETNVQHIDEMLENKCLIRLPKTFREGNEIADTEVKVPEAVKETGVDTSLQNLNMLTST